MFRKVVDGFLLNIGRTKTNELNFDHFLCCSFGPIDDFILLTNNDVLAIVDKKHHLWLHQWSTERGFYEILCDDDFYTSNQPSFVSVNSELLCFTDCEKQIHTFSDCLTGKYRT